MRTVHGWTLMLILSAVVLIGCSGDETPPPPGGVDFRYIEPTNARDSVVIEMTGVDSLTVFDLLSKALKVRHISSVKGAFVTYIDDVGGPDGYFWVYTVNGELINDACDRFKPEDGDTIRWYYRKGGLKGNKEPE